MTWFIDRLPLYGFKFSYGTCVTEVKLAENAVPLPDMLAVGIVISGVMKMAVAFMYPLVVFHNASGTH